MSASLDKSPQADSAPADAVSLCRSSSSFGSGPGFCAARYGIELEAMPDEFVTQLIGNDFLQPFDLLVPEFDHPTGLQVDQMIMVGGRHFLVSRAPIAEIMPRQNARFLK